MPIQALPDKSVLDVGLPTPSDVLDRGAPLARVVMCKLADGGALLSLAVHHALLDGRSMRQVCVLALNVLSYVQGTC